MDWTTFLGHHRQRKWFQNAIEHGRLASTFLFVGTEGIGKRTFARLLAKTLLCTGNEPSQFAPCGHCEACAQIEANTHPDLIQISRPPDKTNLSIDQMVGDKENRMREGLCYEIRMKPYSGRRKIAIVDDMDTLANEGANSLLKTLEEPPPGALIILIGTSEQRQLPTIRSRCQIVRFAPLGDADVAQLVLRHGMVATSDEARDLATRAMGTMSMVAQAKDGTLAEFRTEFLSQLHHRPLDMIRVGKSLVAHIDSVGEGQPRRDRLKLLIDAATDSYRRIMRQSAGLAEVEHRSESDPPAPHLARLTSEQLGNIVRRCMLAHEHIDRMVSPAPAIEAWLADLASLSRT